MSVLPQVGELILVAPEKRDGTVWTSDHAGVDPLLRLGGRLHIEAHAGSIVVGPGLLHMGEDQHPFFRVDRPLDLGHSGKLSLSGRIGTADGIDGPHAGYVHLHGQACVQPLFPPSFSPVPSACHYSVSCISSHLRFPPGKRYLLLGISESKRALRISLNALVVSAASPAEFFLILRPSLPLVKTFPLKNYVCPPLFDKLTNTLTLGASPLLYPPKFTSPS